MSSLCIQTRNSTLQNIFHRPENRRKGETTKKVKRENNKRANKTNDCVHCAKRLIKYLNIVYNVSGWYISYIAILPFIICVFFSVCLQWLLLVVRYFYFVLFPTHCIVNNSCFFSVLPSRCDCRLMPKGKSMSEGAREQQAREKERGKSTQRICGDRCYLYSERMLCYAYGTFTDDTWCCFIAFYEILHCDLRM